MSQPTGAGPPQDAAPLLRPESEQSAAGPEDVQQANSSSSGPGQVSSRWSRVASWFSFSGRRAAEAQRLPASDEAEESELQERGAQAPSIAVVVETPATAAAAEAAGTSASGEASSSSSSTGGEDSGGSGSEIEARGSGSPRMTRMPSRGQPTCLICLEEFRQEEFLNGSALRLECNCRGDLALRHRDCVMKWVQVKGSNICELCKAEIRNIPAPPPRAAESDLPTLDEAYFNDPSHIHDFMPSSQDLVFDCIRVCWVAMIVSILFFEMSLGAALWTGMLAGLAYSIMVRLMYRQHFFAMRRLAEQQAAVRREQEAAAAGGGGGGAAAAAGGEAGAAAPAPAAPAAGAPAPLPVVAAV